MFEPATLGIINASEDFDASESSIAVARRAESHIEVINECRISEFAPGTRAALVQGSNGRLKATTRIAVPEMLIQLLVDDERLKLVSEGYEVVRSGAETNDSYREHLIAEFLQFVNGVADKERRAIVTSTNAD